MTATTQSSLDHHSRPSSSLADEARVLLESYPGLGTKQTDRLVAIFPSLTILEVGLLASDEGLAAKLDGFYKDHGGRIKTPLAHLTVLLAVPLGLVLIIGWAILMQ